MIIKDESSAALDKYTKYDHIEQEGFIGRAPVDDIEKKAIKKAKLQVVTWNIVWIIVMLLALILFYILVGNDELVSKICMTLFCGGMIFFSAFLMCKTIKYEPLVAVAKCVCPTYIVRGSGKYKNIVHRVTVVFEDEKKICDVDTNKKTYEWMEEGDIIYVVKTDDRRAYGVLDAFIKK